MHNVYKHQKYSLIFNSYKLAPHSKLPLGYILASMSALLVINLSIEHRIRTIIWRPWSKSKFNYWKFRFVPSIWQQLFVTYVSFKLLQKFACNTIIIRSHVIVSKKLPLVHTTVKWYCWFLTKLTTPVFWLSIELFYLIT